MTTFTDENTNIKSTNLLYNSILIFALCYFTILIPALMYFILYYRSSNKLYIYKKIHKLLNIIIYIIIYTFGILIFNFIVFLLISTCFNFKIMFIVLLFLFIVSNYIIENVQHLYIELKYEYAFKCYTVNIIRFAFKNNTILELFNFIRILLFTSILYIIYVFYNIKKYDLDG